MINDDEKIKYDDIEAIENEIRYYNNWFGDSTMDVKDARIMWNTDENQKITTIVIAEFNKEKAVRDYSGTFIDICEEGRNRYTGWWPLKLDKLFMKSVGQCNCWWDKSNIYQVILDLFFQYGFADMEGQKRFIEIELKKIKCLKDDLLAHKKRRDYSFTDETTG